MALRDDGDPPIAPPPDPPDSQVPLFPPTYADLVDAIWANELPRLRALVAGGGNVNTANSAGATPVFIGEKKVL